MLSIASSHCILAINCDKVDLTAVTLRSKGGDLRARSLATAADLPARSFDLAHPGVAPPLRAIGATNLKIAC